MLRFFTTRHQLPAIETENASAFNLQSAADYTNKIIPFTHIYITSDPYLRRIKESIGSENQDKIRELNANQKTALLNHQRFPKDLKGLSVNSVTKLHALFPDKDTVHLAVINGFGSAFGDNLVALGIIQRLTKLLAPRQIIFHLMQTMDEKIKPVYHQETNVYLYNNCIPASIFLNMDGYINLTGMLGFPEFDQLPLVQFMATMMSVEKLIPKNDIKPKLITTTTKTLDLKKDILHRFGGLKKNKHKKLLLFHPKASSRIRTMETLTATRLVDALIKAGYLVISAFPYPNPQKGFQDCSDLSGDIDDLLHIIAACDTVISVGTAVYHLAAALNKPTLLLPTVKADVDSGALLSEVFTYIPKKSQSLISHKHKSSEPEDIKKAEDIWKNIDSKDFVKQLTLHENSFSQTDYGIKQNSAPEKVGVIIPHYGSQQKLNTCLDALINVKGFDPQFLYVVDNNKENRYFTAGVNVGIKQALADHCDYVWILNNDTQPDKDYIVATLERFAKNNKIGIIGGKNLVTDRPDRIFWGGSHQAFPTGVHKAGYVSKNSLNQATQESWATFSSVIIRRQALLDCGLLDETMRMIFSDSDYCFNAALNNWQTWYEPNAVLLHDTGVSRQAPNQTIIDIFRSDKRRFYQKWSKLTNETDPEKLQGAIFKKIDWQS